MNFSTATNPNRTQSVMDDRARTTYRKSGLPSRSRAENFERLKKKCVDQIRNKRAQIIAALRSRKQNGDNKNNSSSPPSTMDASFISSSLRQLVRSEVRSRVTGKRSRNDHTTNNQEEEENNNAMEMDDTNQPLRKMARNTSNNSNSNGNSHSNGNNMTMSAASQNSSSSSSSSNHHHQQQQHQEQQQQQQQQQHEEEEEDYEFNENDIEFMMQMEREILEALQNEENIILTEYYESLRTQDMEAVHEEGNQEDLYNRHLQHMGGDDSKVVLCPLCTSSYLLENRSVIFCNCGFRMDSISDAIGLRHTKQALGNVMSAHGGTGCIGTLSFSTTSMFGSGTHLVAECKVCENYQIVM